MTLRVTCYLAGQMVLWVIIALAALCAPHSAWAGRIEAGTFSSTDTFGTPSAGRVTFQQPFDTPPIVVALPTDQGSNSGAIRITNVTTTGFDELVLEPEAWDGPHVSMDVHYIAVEPGRHILPGGQIIEAGRVTTSAMQRGGGVAGTRSWQPVAFTSALPSTPSVISQIQTANSETRNVPQQTSQPFITATLDALSPSGFNVALERSEAASGPIPSAETIGWIAFPAGGTGTFAATNGTTISWSALTTAANIRGWDDGCFTNSFGLTSGNAVVIAKKVTRNGGDGGWLRRCSLSSSTIGLVVDEDTEGDTERSHTSESASIFAFSDSFHANLSASLEVTKVRTSTASALGGDKAIPGAVVTYLITVRNTGNAPPDQDSVIVTEDLPGDLEFVVDDFGAPGSGPVVFTDGSPGDQPQLPVRLTQRSERLPVLFNRRNQLCLRAKR